MEKKEKKATQNPAYPLALDRLEAVEINFGSCKQRDMLGLTLRRTSLRKWVRTKGGQAARTRAKVRHRNTWKRKPPLAFANDASAVTLSHF